MSSWKQELKNIIDILPEDVSLDEAMYQLYVRQKIAMGLKDGSEGRTVPHAEILNKYPLK